EIEQREVTRSLLELEPHPDCPDIFRLQRTLLPGKSPLVPGNVPRKERGLALGTHCRRPEPTTPSQRLPIAGKKTLSERRRPASLPIFQHGILAAEVDPLPFRVAPVRWPF